MLDIGKYNTVIDQYQDDGDGYHNNGYDQLTGDWATYYKVAKYFVHKVKRQDRQDFLHDLRLEMAKVKAKYQAKGKPLMEAGLMRAASYEVADDKAIDIVARLDARRYLQGMPRRLVQIAYKRYSGLPLTEQERRYFNRQKAKELKRHQKILL